METFSALLAICARNSPVPGEFPTQKPVTRSFDVYFDLRSNKRLSTQLWGWWFETQSRPLWRHRNVTWCLHSDISLTLINSSWSCGAFWRQRSWSKLAQVMACCLTITWTSIDISLIRTCGIQMSEWLSLTAFVWQWTATSMRSI